MYWDHTDVERLGVVGSRSINLIDHVQSAVASSPWWGSPIALDDFKFVSGGADGVDTLIETLAEEKEWEVGVIEPDYSDWSRGHPAKVRNTEIVERSDAIVAVWDGKSTGTRDTIDKALDRGVPIYVHVVGENRDDRNI